MPAFEGTAVEAFGSGATLESGSVSPGSMTNGILIVGVLSGDGSPPDHSAVRWKGSGGTLLTQIGTTLQFASFGKISWWRLLNPASGAGTVHVTYASGTSEAALVGAFYTAVDQVTPLGAPATPTTGNGTSMSIAPASDVGDLVLTLGASLDGGGGGPVLTGGTGVTIRADVEGADLGFWCLGLGEKAGASPTTTCGLTISLSNDWAQFGVAMNEAAAAPDPSIKFVRNILRPRIFGPGIAR